MGSLRRRLLVLTALETALVLAVAGGALYFIMRASLLEEFDNALRDKALTLAALVEQERDGIELEFTEAEMAEFRRPVRPEYFQLWDARGEVLARSPSLAGQDLLRPSAAGELPRIGPLQLPDGRLGRVVVVGFTPRVEVQSGAQARGDVLLALARDVLSVHATLSRLGLVAVIVGGVATVMSVILLWWFVRAGLRPADQLAGRIARIDEQQLSMRVDPAHTPEELRPIAMRLNDLLERLETAFARERALTADVAHELRTPLSGLRSNLEVSLTRERSPEAYRATLSECLAVCTQTQSLVESLLALARLDAGSEPVCRERTELRALFAACWKALEPSARDKRLAVDWGVQQDVILNTDPDKLRVVVSSVLENAVHHANAGGSVRVEASRAGPAVRICVANTGSTLAAQDIPRVFDRFWRGDTSRQSNGSHCGLGLALCAASVQRLGGTIAAHSVDGTFILTVNLPLEPPSDEPRPARPTQRSL